MSTTTTVSKFNKKIAKRFEPGIYDVTITDVTVEENDQGGYVKVALQFPDRVINQVYFESNIDYVGKSIANQLGVREQELGFLDILELAKNKPLKVVCSYKTYKSKDGDVTGLNIAYHGYEEEEEPEFE